MNRLSTINTHTTFNIILEITLIVGNMKPLKGGNFSFESFFSSPELKAQVSFSDHLSSVVCPSVCLSICMSVCPSVCKLFTFSSSSPEPLNQTWHKASFGEGNSSFFKWRVMPFAKVRKTWHIVCFGKGNSNLFK